MYEAELRLRRPLVTGSSVWQTRPTFFLKTEGQGGQRWSEAAPLQGWGSESLDECRDSLTRWVQNGERPSTPAARFAVDMLDEDFRSVRTEVQFTLGALGIAETVSEIGLAVESGFSTVKLKVGADSVTRDVQRVAEVSRSFPAVRLRVDANGAWSFEEAKRFLEDSRFFSIDLVEQPVAPDKLAELRTLTDLRIAPIGADESANRADLRDVMLAQRMVDAVVLKPSVFGSIFELRSYVEAADDAGVRVVFSSAIETSIGRRAVGHLAQSLGVKEPSGLHTGHWLERDVAWGRVERGNLCFDEPLLPAAMEEFLKDATLITEAENP
ncbi:MAG: o-succinylbenzoate synthase [bacterium]